MLYRYMAGPIVLMQMQSWPYSSQVGKLQVRSQGWLFLPCMLHAVV